MPISTPPGCNELLAAHGAIVKQVASDILSRAAGPVAAVNRALALARVLVRIVFTTDPTLAPCEWARNPVTAVLPRMSEFVDQYLFDRLRPTNQVWIDIDGWAAQARQSKPWGGDVWGTHDSWGAAALGHGKPQFALHCRIPKGGIAR